MLINILKLTIFQFLISFVIIYYSKKIGLLDIPDNRKNHTHPIPYTGGLILSISFLFLIYITKRLWLCLQSI